MTEKKPKVAILYFGLTRSLPDTIDSIKQHMFQPILDSGMEYDVFMHTYIINGSYTNRWSDENVTNYDNEQYKLLEPTHFISDIQDEILSQINLDDYFTKLESWTGFDGPLTCYLIRNMILALKSKKRITELLEKHIDEYDYVIISRPDLKFNKPIPWKEITESLNETNIAIPSQEWWAGCNDKVCICKPNIALFVGRLYDHLLEYSTHKSIVSERYFKDMLDALDITILPTELDFHTIRARNN
jgi:hypothetical protein